MIHTGGIVSICDLRSTALSYLMDILHCVVLMMFMFVFVVPVEFTQYFKVSYPRQTGLPDGYTLDFYFVFLREGVLGSQSNVSV